MMIEITQTTDIHRAKQALRGPLEFGKTFADLMVTICHTENRGWHDAKIVPFGPLQLSPAAKSLHYSLEIFEGHKAYRRPDGEIALFRPNLNIQRFNRSAARMAMPPIDEALHLSACHTLVDQIRPWVPNTEGTLYLRPFLIATEPALGVMPSKEHLFCLIASPVAGYFGKATTLSIKVETKRTRAAGGGVGYAKTGGNYAASMASKQQAMQEGFNDVMFLDGHEHRYLEELSAMNIVLVAQDTLITPPVSETILDGITRRSIIELATDRRIKVEERPISIEEVESGIKAGTITEMMAVGTAAVIAPIGRIGLSSDRLTIGTGKEGPLAKQLKETLTDIQFGRIPDPFGWMQMVQREPAFVSQAVG